MPMQRNSIWNPFASQTLGSNIRQIPQSTQLHQLDLTFHRHLLDPKQVA